MFIPTFNQEVVTTASVEKCPRSKAEQEEATFPPGRALDC